MKKCIYPHDHIDQQRSIFIVDLVIYNFKDRVLRIRSFASSHSQKIYILLVQLPFKGESQNKTMTYLARVSTPRCVQFISARICSSSRFRRETLLLASATSDFKRSGSYLVLNELELEHTIGKINHYCLVGFITRLKYIFHRFFVTHHYNEL